MLSHDAHQRSSFAVLASSPLLDEELRSLSSFRGERPQSRSSERQRLDSMRARCASAVSSSCSPEETAGPAGGGAHEETLFGAPSPSSSPPPVGEWPDLSRLPWESDEDGEEQPPRSDSPTLRSISPGQPRPTARTHDPEYEALLQRERLRERQPLSPSDAALIARMSQPMRQSLLFRPATAAARLSPREAPREMQGACQWNWATEDTMHHAQAPAAAEAPQEPKNSEAFWRQSSTAPAMTPRRRSGSNCSSSPTPQPSAPLPAMAVQHRPVRTPPASAARPPQLPPSSPTPTAARAPERPSTSIPRHGRPPMSPTAGRQRQAAAPPEPLDSFLTRQQAFSEMYRKKAEERGQAERR